MQEEQSVIKIMLVDDQVERAALVEATLIDNNFDVVANLPNASGLLHQIGLHMPDIVLMELDSPDRDILESLAFVNNHHPIPVVMFSEDDSQQFMQQAVEAGVSAYMTHAIDPNKVKTAIDLAMVQFRQHQALKQALIDSKAELEVRKRIERAKGLLMATQKLTEQQAHKHLRDLAMRERWRLEQAADKLIENLLPKTSDVETTKEVGCER
ncbi:ANTAR domain-containing response regulator [Echinimonas agarilytica]|uniref:ANTAR domain-containing protein n=1 Tax=Echinimonas agarilytica TaxID=1215918 RepID=A0AA41W508_9GAMM|nr:ANTAR domain-containing protein [Echinimonas agarilytica]MCM2678918.1 ANTAR domain-containing protein [Echinimonas agarilytica]